MKRCKCTLAERMVGDGCEVCNPEMALEVAKDTIETLDTEIARLRRKVAYYIREARKWRRQAKMAHGLAAQWYIDRIEAVRNARSDDFDITIQQEPTEDKSNE